MLAVPISVPLGRMATTRSSRREHEPEPEPATSNLVLTDTVSKYGALGRFHFPAGTRVDDMPEPYRTNALNTPGLTAEAP